MSEVPLYCVGFGSDRSALTYSPVGRDPPQLGCLHIFPQHSHLRVGSGLSFLLYSSFRVGRVLQFGLQVQDFGLRVSGVAPPADGLYAHLPAALASACGFRT